MEFRKSQTKNWYLQDTIIENIYISEYMAGAPGDYVKVYLLALMYANLAVAPSIKTMAKQLMLEEQTIHDAWIYWESIGVVRKIRKKDDGQYSIEFLSAKEGLYGKGFQKAEEENNKNSSENPGEEVQSSSEGEKKDIFYDKKIAEMYAEVERILSRQLGATEPLEMVSWIDDFGATPEMIIYAYSYCKQKIKVDNTRYVGKIVREWAEHSLYTTDKIEEYLEENDRSHFLQKRIFKALGFMRNPTEAEKAIMDRWLDSEGFTIDKILDACAKTSGISNPNLNYVDKVLMSWKNEGKNPSANGSNAGQTSASETFNMSTIMKYYEYIRERSQNEAKRRTEEVYNRFPEIKSIDEKIRLSSMEMSKSLLAGDREGAKTLRAKTEGLMAQKAAILTDNNLPADYMEDKYLCQICKDTGIKDTGERCSCFEQRQNEAREWHSSSRG